MAAVRGGGRGDLILVGTSGYAYADWKGTFYPPGLPDGDRLAWYAARFPALEVNFTYYRLPKPRQLAAMADAGGGLFLTVKACGTMTHDGTAGEGDYRSFREALEPVADRGLLGCVLAQFPWAFRPSKESRTALLKIRDGLGPFPLVVEFRHASWAAAETFAFLRDEKIGFCAVDEPRLKGLFPPLSEVTSPIAYVRFHGRNGRAWWRHEKPHERYEYLYRRAQLEEWLPRIKAMDDRAERTFLFANNHFGGNAAVNAAMLMEMTGAEGPAPTASGSG